MDKSKDYLRNLGDQANGCLNLVLTGQSDNNDEMKFELWKTELGQSKGDPEGKEGEEK